MTEEDYLQQRLDDQIRWYDEKSGANQRAYKIIRLTEIVAAASIPVLVGLIPSYQWLVTVVGVLGAAIAVMAGAQSLGKYHENWIEYRSVCESLRNEKYMYLTRSGVYEAENPFRLLVERTESIISRENINWAQVNKTDVRG